MRACFLGQDLTNATVSIARTNNSVVHSTDILFFRPTVKKIRPLNHVAI